MFQKNAIFLFLENGIPREITCAISQLKKENDGEILYTQNGFRIPLENLISVNGMSFV